jgi:hypothetical protein
MNSYYVDTNMLKNDIVINEVIVPLHKEVHMIGYVFPFKNFL